MRRALVLPLAGGALAAGAASVTAARFYRDRSLADRDWATSCPEPFAHPAAVARLAILPLIDYYTDNDSLVGEPGVSYLITADDFTVLFDVGLNRAGDSPSPLARNMGTLGIERDAIDAVFISHRHTDHTGGIKAQKARTFIVTPDDTQPPRCVAYVPEVMDHHTACIELVDGPRAIAPGVFSIGPIARSIWLLGMTREQALAVNVAGKGIVLIIGCGHQTLERAVERTASLFAEPLYAVVGGLHFPVTGSRLPLGLQRFIGTGRPPWQPIRKSDVQRTVHHLQQKEPRLVGISAHDSCDWAVGQFRDAFGDRYVDVVVGREIVV